MNFDVANATIVSLSHVTPFARALSALCPFKYRSKFISRTGTEPFACWIRIFNVHRSTIARLRQRFHTTGRVADRPRPGAPPVTTAAQDRRIRLQHLRNRFQTAAATARGTVGTRRRQISPQTVRRRLAAFGIRCRRPYQGQILLHRHRLARQQWTANRGY